MRNCKDCKFFIASLNDKYPNDNDCRNPAFVYTGQGETTGVDELGYWDGESYSAGFHVGPEFGCIHFVKR